MTAMFEWLKVIVVAQLFYGFCVTTLVYSMPSDAIADTQIFQDVASTQTYGTISGKISDSMQKQIKVPIVDVTALIVFSGNLILDLILNSIFALPSMLSLAIAALFMFVNIDPQLATTVKIFITAVAVILYLFGLMAFLANMRSQSQVVY